jgi:hypothetical protein
MAYWVTVFPDDGAHTIANFSVGFDRVMLSAKGLQRRGHERCPIPAVSFDMICDPGSADDGRITSQAMGTERVSGQLIFPPRLPIGSLVPAMPWRTIRQLPHPFICLKQRPTPPAVLQSPL